MYQLWLTIRNFVILDSFNPKVFVFLYRECNVKVVRNNKRDTACVWWFNREGVEDIRNIQIGRMKNQSQVITALLHEVGHCHDIFRYGADKFDSMPEKEQEKSAWKWAIRFSQRYDLKIDYELAIRWLGTYDVQYMRLEKLASNKKFIK